MKWIQEDDWEELMAFLPCTTPSAWVDAAKLNEETLLLNHCYLEQCAARTAMTLMFRCPERPELLAKMSKLVREELHHFDQVHKILHELSIWISTFVAGEYAIQEQIDRWGMRARS